MVESLQDLVDLPPEVAIYTRDGIWQQLADSASPYIGDLLHHRKIAIVGGTGELYHYSGRVWVWK